MASNEYNESEKVVQAPQAATNGNGASQERNGSGAAQTAPPTSSAPTSPGSADGDAKRNNKPVVLIILIILVALGGMWGAKYFHYNQNHAVTDDAYVAGDLINVSPIISGTLVQLYVEEGDQVKAGQIVARLDDSGPKAAYQQALAQWKAAESQIPQAQTNLTYTTQTTADQIAQAEAALAAQNAKVQQESTKTHQIRQTTLSQLAQSQAQAQAAQQQVQTAKAQYATSLAAVRTAQAAASAVRQAVVAAQANATRAHRDQVRYASLYGPNGTIGAVTSQQYDAAVAADQAAAAQLAQAQEQARQAQEAVSQAQSQADATKAGIEAAQSQADAALSGVHVARAGLLQVPVQQGSVNSNIQSARQNVAQLSAAQAGSQQIKLRQQMIETLQAQALASQRIVEQTKVTLDDTVIRAPSDGVVVKKGANVGDALSPGQTMFTMTRGSGVWVSANFKETQVQHMHPGQRVDVEVDAYPGIVYRGEVKSINEASGNATALLPADNATGNFTKVVQRIPVKIRLIPQEKGNKDHLATEADIERLRQGMSVNAAVDIENP
ncbi:MAG TPA: HlyD family secretion protein [Capsulimonadaceae bacterium]|jgi:membrane fusion protein (multidrug efflux system)